jgi:hypothetical protein
VSDLLIQNPTLKKDCWNIIYADQNRDKAYTRIRDGTEIYFDPSTRELLWGDMVERSGGRTDVASGSPEPEVSEGIPATLSATSKNAAADPVTTADDAKEPNTCLVDAVRPMIGRSYSDMNCYELIVTGLDRMGVRYYGRSGLGHRMMNAAIEKGLPLNAYLNGEGLVRFSGTETYRKALLKVSDPESQARKVMEEISPLLEKGSILSFSTESQGHTGIVANNNGAWTYINSGVMDHPVAAASSGKEVGEEKLDREIENWFQLAARHNESLVITLGKLSQAKLAAFGGGRELSVS